MSSPALSPHTGAPPEPPLLPPTPAPQEFYCYECDAMVTLHEHDPAPAPAAPSSARPRPRPFCPFCHSDFIEESPSSNPPPPPPPPPLLFSGSSSPSLSDDPDADDDFDILVDPEEARAYLSRLAHRFRINDGSFDADAAAAAAAAVSVMQQHGRPGGADPHATADSIAAAAAAAVSVLQQRGRGHGLGRRAGGDPPATAASIAALPTVDVADPAAVCAICKDDLPLASQARKLPCAHLYHSSCIVTWLQMHNSCPVCRFRIPSAADGPEDEDTAPPEQEQEQHPLPTRITIRVSTTIRRRTRVGPAAPLPAPISASPTQLAQAITGDGVGGPANSGETVSSEWPPHPESDTVMSEAREDDGFFD